MTVINESRGQDKLRVLSATLEDGGTLEMKCSAPFEKSSAAMEAALRVLDTPIERRESIGLMGVISKWWRG